MLDGLSAGSGRGGLLPAAWSDHDSEMAKHAKPLDDPISRPVPLHSRLLSHRHFAAQGRFRCLCTAGCCSFPLRLRTGLTWESLPWSCRPFQRQNGACVVSDLMTSTSSYDFNNLQDLTESFGADRSAPENPNSCPGAWRPMQLPLLLKFHGCLAWSGGASCNSQRTVNSSSIHRILADAQNVGHDVIRLQCLWTRSSGWRRMRSAGCILSRPHLHASLTGQN